MTQTRRQILAKATITTADVTSGLLAPETASKFIATMKETGVFGQAIGSRMVTASSGEIDKVSTGSRLIRLATENADDGYRAGATFGSVPYQTNKIRLPWEVTEDVYHQNIEGQGFESTLVKQMTTQFGLDLDDLDINGDTAAVGADSAFLTINDGILKQITASAIAGRTINGSLINGGAISKDHFFEMNYAMPNKYRNSGNLRWLCSPNRAISWWEALTNRAGAAGDALLGGNGATAASSSPIGIPFWPCPQMPDSTMILVDPKNIVRVTSWEMRKRKVTGETDASLAARDKRFYVYFLKEDVIIEELDAVVRLHSLGAV